MSSLALPRPAPRAAHPARGSAVKALQALMWAVVLVGLAALLALLEPSLVAALVAAVPVLLLVLVQPLVVIPLLLASVPFGGLVRVGGEDLSLTPTEGLAALLALAWLARAVQLHRLNLRQGALVGSILALTTLMLFSITYAISPALAVKESLKWLELLLVLLATVDMVSAVRADPGKEKRLVCWLVAALLVCGGLEATWGVVQFATGSGPAAFSVDGALRAYGHFEQPNPFAGYLGTILPVGVMLALSKSTPRPLRRLAALSSLALAAGILLSQSRGAWLGLTVALLVGLLTWSARTRRWLLAAFWMAVIGAGVAVSGVLPANIADRLSSVVDNFGVFDVRTVDVTSQNWAIVERMAHWQAGWYMFQDSPWLGVGAGNYSAAYPRYYVADWLEPLGHAHNYFLNTAAELGIVGLSLLLVVLWAAFRLLLGAVVSKAPANQQLDDRPFWRALAAGILGSMVLFCAHNLFDNLFVHAVNVQLGFLLALAVLAGDHLRPREASAHSVVSFPLGLSRRAFRPLTGHD